MIKELVKIANTLDRLNLQKEADLIDLIIKSASEDDEFSYPDYSSLPREPEEDPYEERPKKKFNYEEWKKERRAKIIKRDRAFKKRILDHIIDSANKSSIPVTLLNKYLQREESSLRHLREEYEAIKGGGEGRYGEKDIMVVLERILLSEKMIGEIQSLIEERE
jgi:hypothetical protein